MIEDILRQAGLAEDTISKLVSSLKERNPFFGSTPMDLAIEDTQTGRLCLPAKARRHYQAVFASVGLDLRRYLTDRKVLAQAWLKVCRLRRQKLLAEDNPPGVAGEFSRAMARKDFDQAARLFSVMERRSRMRPV